MRYIALLFAALLFAPTASVSQSQSTPLSFEEDCLQLFYLGNGYAQSQGHRQQGYDTLKVFVERCAPNGAFTTWDAFSPMAEAVQYMGGGYERYITYRDWLKAVLYLDQIHPEFYCRAVDAIAFTYNRDGSSSENMKAQQAIIQYLLESKKCDIEDRPDLLESYNTLRELIYKKWADTTTVDTNIVKMDTTLPTLEDLDLEILRGPKQSVAGSNETTSLLDIRALSNPFITSVEIEYTLARLSQVEVTLFDAIGKVLWTKPFGEVEDANTHHIYIAASELMPGSYFLRIATLTGEVKTVKLVKQ